MAQPAPAPVDAASAPPPGSLATEGAWGFMLTAPVLIGASVPISLLGNRAWRDACGPNSRTRDCRPGTTLSLAARTGTGILFGSAGLLMWVGGKRLGARHALRDHGLRREWINTKAVSLGGGVLTVLSSAGMISLRAYFWQAAPRCTNYSCVQRTQNLATLTMSSLALTASMGVAMIGYAQGYRRQKGVININMSLLPEAGRGFAGLRLRGSF